MWRSSAWGRSGSAPCRALASWARRRSSRSIRSKCAAISLSSSAPRPCSIRMSTRAGTSSPRSRTCARTTDRIYAGGSYQAANRAGIAANIGPDLVIEAVGLRPVQAEGRSRPGPDRHGAAGAGVADDAHRRAICARAASASRRKPRCRSRSASGPTGARPITPASTAGPTRCARCRGYVRLIERGLFDAKSMITDKYTLDKIMDAYDAVAYRTTVTAMIAMG